MPKQQYHPVNGNVSLPDPETEVDQPMETEEESGESEALEAVEDVTPRASAPRPVIATPPQKRLQTDIMPNVILPRDQGVLPWEKGQRLLNPIDMQIAGRTREELHAQPKFLVILQRARRDEPNYCAVWINGYLAAKIWRGRRAEVPLAVYLQLVEAGEVEPDESRPQDWNLYPFGGMVDQDGREIKQDYTGRDMQVQLGDMELTRDSRPLIYATRSA